MMSVLKGKEMDKKQVQETYRETTPEEEQEYFEEVENELQCDLQTTQESIDYRNIFYRTCGKAGRCTGAPDRESVFWKDCI